MVMLLLLLVLVFMLVHYIPLMGKYLGHESMIKVTSHNILIHFVYIGARKASTLRDIVVKCV